MTSGFDNAEKQRVETKTNARIYSKKTGWLGKLAIVGIVVLLVVNMVSQNRNRAVKDSQIKRDIMLEDYVFQKDALEIDTLKITERKTAENGTFDMICLTMTASNSEYQYVANCDITYGKYQGGWQVDSLQIWGRKYFSKEDCQLYVLEEIIREETEEYGEAVSTNIIEREGDGSFQVVKCAFTLVGYDGRARGLVARCSVAFSPDGWTESSISFYDAETGENIALLGWYMYGNNLY